MSYIVNRTYTTTCPGALLSAVNADATIVVSCEQIVDLGGGTTDFYFATTLTSPQLAGLDALLSAFVCPVLQNPIDTATLNDTISGPDVIWSSDKVTSELTTNVDHTNLLNKGTNTHAQLDTHVADASVHYAQTAIDHTNLLNAGTNTHAQLDTHVADASVHYAQTAIDHTNLLNAGTNTHAQLDTHLASTSNPHSVTANQVLPSQTGKGGLFLTTDGNDVSWVANPGGTVTSVGLSAPAIFTVAGSPVTSSGTLELSLATQVKNTVFAGPTTGADAAPAFRTISMVGNDLSDVALTSPADTQVLTYNAGISKWVNTTTAATSYSALITSWTLISGNQYYADVVHNLGTLNVVISLFNATTNALIQANSIVLTSTTTVRIIVTGTPAYNIRCNVIANGTTIAAGASTPSSVIVQQGGVPLSGTYTTLNIGGGLAVTNSGSGVATVTTASAVILRTLSYFPTSLDSPNNSDWVVNSLAPTISDPVRPAINVRQFSNTVEQGVGMYVPIPAGATNVTVEYRGRAEIAPGAAANLQLKWYTRQIPNNAAVTSWTAGANLNAVVVPTNSYVQYYSHSMSLAALGLTVGNLYQFEITRNVAVAGNLASNWLLLELTITFT